MKLNEQSIKHNYKYLQYVYNENYLQSSCSINENIVLNQENMVNKMLMADSSWIIKSFSYTFAPRNHPVK
jgi:hypothetical protein